MLGTTMRARDWLVSLALAVSLAACSRDRAEAHPMERAPAASTPAPEAARAALPAIVFLGDSLTAGRGLEEQDALPAVLQERIDAAGLGFRVINGGRSGDTTAGGAARLKWYFRDSVDLRVLIIGLGSNDAMRGQPVASIESNLHQLIAAAREHDPKLKIFLWELKTFPNMGAEYGTAFEQVFPHVAAQEHVQLLPFPLQGVAGKPELNQTDGIHPTPKGTQLVADNVWRVLEPELRSLANARGGPGK